MIFLWHKEGGKMLEESQNHRARVTPDSQEKHNYLAEVVGTPNFQGELKLMESLKK